MRKDNKVYNQESQTDWGDDAGSFLDLGQTGRWVLSSKLLPQSPLNSKFSNTHSFQALKPVHLTRGETALRAKRDAWERAQCFHWVYWSDIQCHEVQAIVNNHYHMGALNLSPPLARVSRLPRDAASTQVFILERILYACSHSMLGSYTTMNHKRKKEAGVGVGQKACTENVE